MRKVIIAGYGKMFTNIIAGTLDAGDKIVGVYRYDYVKLNPIIRFFKDIFNPSKELTYIKSLGLKEIKSPSINSDDFRKKIIKSNADIVFVASWGEKIKKETFICPKIGCINVHPSLLPKYRGPNPYLAVIKNRESESGVTFHLIDEKWDNGAILAQRRVPILVDDTGDELRNRITLQARGAVFELLKMLQDEIILPVNQNANEATYYSLSNLDNKINFNTNAEDIKALIQAFHPWQGCYAEFKNKFILINPYGIEVSDNHTNYTRAGTITEINSSKELMSVLCGNGKIITFRAKPEFGLLNFFKKNSLSNMFKIGDCDSYIK